jgi:hypothetical protein
MIILIMIIIIIILKIYNYLKKKIYKIYKNYGIWKKHLIMFFILENKIKNKDHKY